MNESHLHVLEEILQYQFYDKEILIRAISHASAAEQNNQRMEYLGDAVLELCVSDYLYHKFEENDEGFLTKMRAAIVCEDTLSKWAKHKKIASYLILGKGEELSGGREKPSILSDFVEALVAAVYLDGGYGKANGICKDIISFAVNSLQVVATDAKTMVQSLLQAKKAQDPRYRVYREEGPSHDKTYFVEILVGGEVLAQGKGPSKKSAEQDAAKNALYKL